LSFSSQTIIGAYTEIGESLHRCGVRKLVIVTSHGGNVAAMDIVARDLRVRLEMLVVTCGWHRFGYPPGTFERAEQRHGIHAGDVETSLMLAGSPDTVRMDEAVDAVPETVRMAQDFKWLSAFRPVGFGWMTQDLHPTGAVGDGTLATAAKGEQSLDHGAQAFVELLQDVDRFDLARLRDGPRGARTSE
jgi:creatinine amidohydrolase